MRSLLVAFAFFASLATSVMAQRAPVVVELFTSQGCSSCPPADAILQDLSARSDIIALALHVDYWDYIGWKDEFADPRHAERQRAYARVSHRRSIYTPEFIVDGRTDIVGAKPIALMEAIAAHAAAPAALDVTLSRNNGTLVIDAQTVAPVPPTLDIHLLRYQPAREARITRGENAGRHFVYSNVAQDWTVVGQWDTSAPLQLQLPIVDDMPVVVLLQETKAGPILGAAALN